MEFLQTEGTTWGRTALILSRRENHPVYYMHETRGLGAVGVILAATLEGRRQPCPSCGRGSR